MKKLIALIFIISILVLSACGSSNMPTSSTTTPSATKPMPTATITLTYTPSPTSTVTPAPTPQPITSANIDKISEAFQIGAGTISDVSWLSDGNIATTHSVGVSIYDSKTLKQIKTVQPINRVPLSDSVVSYNGKYVASLVENEIIQVWDIDSGKIIHKIETKCQISGRNDKNRIAFSYDDTKLFGCDEMGISSWDLSDLKKTVIFETRYSYTTIIVNSNDSYMAVFGFSVGVNNGEIVVNYGENVVLNIATGEIIRTFPNSFYMGFSHDGSMLAVADRSNVVIYETGSDKVLTTISGFTGVVEFSSDDKIIAIGGSYYDGTKFADIATGKIVSTLENVAASMIRYSPDGNRIIIRSSEVSVWSTTDNVNYKQIGKTEIFNPYMQVVFDPKSKYLAVGGRGSFTALWDLEKNAALNYVFAHGDNFIFDPTGTFLVTRAWNENNWWGSIQLWNLRTKISSQFDNFIEKVAYTSMRPLFCPSNNCIAAGFEQQQIKFWDTSSHKLLFTLEQPGLSDYEFSPNGAFFASSGNNALTFWDLDTQQPIRKLYAGEQISDISFSPDSNLMAWAADGVLVLNTDNLQFANEFKEIQRARNISFNPTGNLLAAIGYIPHRYESQPILYVWDISNNNLLYQITGEQTFDESDSYAEIIFSPDGSLIALKNFSPYIQFVDTETGQLVKSLDTFEPSPNIFQPNAPKVYSSYSMGFSPDGRLFATTDVNGIVHILNISP